MKNNPDNGDILINVMEEQAHVQKQVTENAKVRITKQVHEENETIDLSEKSQEVKVHKVAVNKYVDEAPAVRYEGDTIIVPVMKEVVVVEKRLLLVEEIHVTRNTVVTKDQQTIPLLREEIHVERITREKINE